jgi:hypothetical protein
VPIDGCRWNPGEHRDLGLLNVATGEVRTAVTIADVEDRYGDRLKSEFGGNPTSVFFPHIPPDGRKVFFIQAQERQPSPWKPGVCSFPDSLVPRAERAAEAGGDMARNMLFLTDRSPHQGWPGCHISDPT